MFRLATILFSVISTTLMGSGVITVLSMGHDTLGPILIAAAAGFALAIPTSWWVARRILSGSTFVK